MFSSRRLFNSWFIVLKRSFNVLPCRVQETKFSGSVILSKFNVVQVEKVSRVVVWSDLPTDVMPIIFKYLGVEDLITGAPLCCSSWYNASKDPIVWMRPEVVIAYSKFNTNHRVRRKFVDSLVARSQGNLTSVKFPLSPYSVDLLDLIADRCPKLKYFHLRVVLEDSLRKAQFMKILVQFCMTFSKLKELEGMAVEDNLLRCTRVSSRKLSTVKQISQFCPKFSKLKVLDALSDSIAYNISEALPKLKVMDLSYTATRERAVLTLLNHCKELVSLNIIGCPITIHHNDYIIRAAELRGLKDFKFEYDAFLRSVYFNIDWLKQNNFLL